MTNIVGILNTGIEDKSPKIAQGDEDLVEVLLQKIKTIDIVFRDIAYNLANLLSKHRDLVEKLLKRELSLTERLNEDDIMKGGYGVSNTLTKYSAAYYERWGILNLFRGELYQAHYHLVEAQQSIVAASVLKAYQIFQSAYSQIITIK